jgi:hypothetical protein
VGAADAAVAVGVVAEEAVAGALKWCPTVPMILLLPLVAEAGAAEPGRCLS